MANRKSKKRRPMTKRKILWEGHEIVSAVWAWKRTSNRQSHFHKQKSTKRFMKEKPHHFTHCSLHFKPLTIFICFPSKTVHKDLVQSLIKGTFLTDSQRLFFRGGKPELRTVTISGYLQESAQGWRNSDYLLIRRLTMIRIDSAFTLKMNDSLYCYILVGVGSEVDEKPSWKPQGEPVFHSTNWKHSLG